MKYSSYNSIIDLTDISCLLYNGFSDEFIIFRKNLSDLILNLTPEELLIHCPDLYLKMVTAGALIMDDENEFENLKQRSIDVDSKSNEYQLFINPTMNCNFKCWYCYETHLKGSQVSLETLYKIKIFISSIFSSNAKLEHFHLSFFGGEPLLYYKQTIQPIIDSFTEECKRHDVSFHISFTTNGYLINNELLTHLKPFSDSISFQITLDGNREQHNKVRFNSNKSGSYDKIISNVKKIINANMMVILRINYTGENLFSVKDIHTDIGTISKDKRSKLRISFHRVWQDNEIKKEQGGKIDEIIDLFRGDFNVVAAHYELDDLKYSCYADKLNEAVINYNGDIFKCTARDFLPENRCGYLSESGQIVWENRYFSRIQSIKMQKSHCQFCRILPLCGGGCSQKSLETIGKEICLSQYNENDKNQIILHRFYNRFIKKRI